MENGVKEERVQESNIHAQRDDERSELDYLGTNGADRWI